MYNRIVFVDFENLQKIKPEFLTVDTKLIVLCGASQGKTALNLTKEHIGSPCTIEFIKPNVQGKNALDFCLVFYVGMNIGSFKDSQIVIYSNDKDYDPLIKHLKEIGINCVKEAYEETKVSKQVVTKQKKAIDSVTGSTSIEKAYEEAISHFRKIKQPKSNPRKIKTLKTYLKTALNKKYTDKIIEQVVNLMVKNKIAEETGTGDAIKFNKDKLQ